MPKKRKYTKDGRVIVAKVLSYDNWLTPQQIVDRTGLSREQVYYILHRMNRDGLLEHSGQTRNSRWKLSSETVAGDRKDLEFSKELEMYFKWPASYTTVEDYCVTTNTPEVTAYRYIKKWHEQGLVERANPDRLTMSGKRVRRYKRLYNAVTYTVDGEVIAQRTGRLG